MGRISVVRHYLFITLLCLGTLGMMAGFASADPAPTAAGLDSAMQYIGLGGWPALVVGILIGLAYLARWLTEDTSWLHSKKGAAFLSIVPGLLSGAASAIQQHGLTVKAATTAVAAALVSLAVISNRPSKTTRRKKKAQKKTQKEAVS